ncbi:MAG: hypothetical protein R2788_26350 [Saprospiraceae bacterium]
MKYQISSYPHGCMRTHAGAHGLIYYRIKSNGKSINKKVGLKFLDHWANDLIILYFCVLCSIRTYLSIQQAKTDEKVDLLEEILHTNQKFAFVKSRSTNEGTKYDRRIK